MMMNYLVRHAPYLIAAAFVALAAQPSFAQRRPEPSSGSVRAQTPDPSNQRPAPAPATPGTPAPRQANECECEPAGQSVNLQIDVAISDQSGSAPPEKKTVSMIVADGAFGRIRATTVRPVGTLGAVAVKLNVDARPTLQANGSIRLLLTLEYEPLPPSAEADSVRRPSPLNESLTVILQPGKPLTVSRAADPLTDRRISVDVTATLLK